MESLEIISFAFGSEKESEGSLISPVGSPALSESRPASAGSRPDLPQTRHRPLVAHNMALPPRIP